MERKNKYRLAILLLSIFFVFNLAAFGVLVYQHLRHRAPSVKPTTSEAPAGGIMRQLRHDVGFDSLQLQHFYAIKGEHKRVVRPLFDSIDLIKVKLLTEIGKDKPDTVLLLSYNRQLAALETQARAEAILFMVRLDTMCNTQQKVRLRTIFTRLLDETTPSSHHHRHKKGRKDK